jgi:acyl carrier protein
VGWAVPDTQALIIRGDRTQAGVGEPGEIVVRSPFIARGYLNAQGDRGFRRNPFRDDPDDRVYATGDVGYAEVDGAITVCGRIDDQLKIRGVRVEPAEVAAVIRAHPQVTDAFVVARGEGDASVLYAYVVAPHAPPAVHEIRAWIAERLVDAMVPASIRFLERLPLTANGKVDRAALPAPEQAVAQRVPPRNDLEAAVLSIWSSVLSRGDLGVTDDFFENGGDSLAATRVLARIHIELDAVLPISALFDASTVAGLAAAVGKLRHAATPA